MLKVSSVKSFIKSNGNKLKINGSKLIAKVPDIKSFIKSNNNKLTYIRDFILFNLMYGTLITLMLSTLLPDTFGFSLKLVVALGICFYFIKEEVPSIVNKAIK